MPHISAFVYSLVSFSVSVCHDLFSQLIIGWILSSYMVLQTTRLSNWTWDLFIRNFSAGRATLPNEEEEEEAGIISQYEEKQGSEEGEECAVCLSKMEEGDEIRELRCEHLFHRVCLDRWTQYKRWTCPVCRGSLAPPPPPGRAVAELPLLSRFCSSTS